MSRHYDVMTSHERNPFSLSQSSVAQLLSNNSALANYATCRVSVITSYQDVSRLIVRNTNRIDINDLQTLCSTHLTSNPSPPSRTRRLSRTTGKLRWVLRLCKLRAVPSLHMYGFFSMHRNFFPSMEKFFHARKKKFHGFPDLTPKHVRILPGCSELVPMGHPSTGGVG